MTVVLKTQDQEVKLTMPEGVKIEDAVKALEQISPSVEITEWVGPRPKK